MRMPKMLIFFFLSTGLLVFAGAYSCKQLDLSKYAGLPCKTIRDCTNDFQCIGGRCLPPGMDLGRHDTVGQKDAWDVVGTDPGPGDKTQPTDITGDIQIRDLGHKDVSLDETGPVDVYIPACGNGICDPDENCATCPADCGSCCGDGTCDHGEDCSLCPKDCGCGNGVCVKGACCTPKTCTDLGKGCGAGFDDECGGKVFCGECPIHQACEAGKCVDQPYCGNGKCEPDHAEDCATCPADCACKAGQTCFNASCCTPKTCTDLGKECGFGYDDECGGVLYCWECADYQACQDGKCVCPGSQVVCSGTCTPLGTDTDCSACGDKCAEGGLCQSGKCKCPNSQVVCSGKCTPLGTDTDCSACGDECTGGKTCQSGKCKCPGSQVVCSGKCTPLGTDTDCSACGDECGNAQACISGKCQAIWTDPATGYEWQVNPTGSDMMSWQDAIDHCKNLDPNGGNWRLPTISELRSLIRGCAATVTGGSCDVTDNCLRVSCQDDACNGCANDKGPGLNGCYGPSELQWPYYGCWSSSSVAGSPSYAWYVDFDVGVVFYYGEDVSNGARCVRLGP